MLSALPIAPVDSQWGKYCPEDSDLIFDRGFMKLAGNKDSHKILIEFYLGLDQTIHFRVTCPVVTKNIA